MAHIPVLLDEVVESFRGVKIKVFFDGTLGAGGHAAAILESHPEIKTYIGCDQDAIAHVHAARRLTRWKDKVVHIHGNYQHLDKYLEEMDIDLVDGFFLT